MRYVVLLLVAAVMLFPLYWMAITALQPVMGIMRFPPNFFPESFSLDNFTIIFTSVPWARWILNTVMVVVGTIVLSVGISTAAGYAFSAFRFKGRDAIFAGFLATLMVSRYALLIPLFVIMARGGIRGLPAVILPCVFSPVGIYLFRTYADSIPRSFIESARIDGASELRILTRIMMPLCGPAVATLAVFAGIASLQDYVWQYLALQRTSDWTLLKGLIRSAYDSNLGASWYMINYGAFAAAGVVLLLPLVAIFAFTSRYFIRGLALGGEKE